ncbi:hypothetical protein AUP74_01797 [Microbulbifer aggregans]|uniref:Uncharacterized protein n=1 Tax=Microbulbifer aggregans TaxID=1769779 RepID=A0A1C9W7X1_9GAMM|nr:hypothetical protein AUP74_01797 [Microbulbifer aggregans]
MKQQDSPVVVVSMKVLSVPDATHVASAPASLVNLIQAKNWTEIFSCFLPVFFKRFMARGSHRRSCRWIIFQAPFSPFLHTSQNGRRPAIDYQFSKSSCCRTELSGDSPKIDVGNSFHLRPVSFCFSGRIGEYASTAISSALYDMSSCYAESQLLVAAPLSMSSAERSS